MSAQDHRAALSALPKPLKASLMIRSNRTGMRHLALYFAAMALTTAYIVLQAPLWGLALIPHGLLLVFLFTLSHECTHQTPFRAPWLSDLVGHLIAPILFLPFLWFRYFHLAHHKYTNDPERDPEIAGHPRPDSWSSYAVYLSGWGYWTGGIRVLINNAFGSITASYLPSRKHVALRREARGILAVQAALLTTLLWSPLALWLWLVPMVLAQPVLRLYLLAEHGLCPPVANMLENTRTTYTNRMVRFLAWNMPYHIEHHASPNVPFYKLPELNAALQDELISTSEGYAEFTGDYLRHLNTPKPEARP